MKTAEEPPCAEGEDQAGRAAVTFGRVSLPETVIHWFGWTFGCVYSAYRLYDVIRRNPDTLDTHSSPGWLPGLSVDSWDDELEVIVKGQAPTYAVFMTIHLVVSHYLRGLALFKVLPLFHALLAAAYFCFSVGFYHYLLMLGTALIMFAASRLRSRLLSWLLFVAALLGHNLLLAAVAGPTTSDDAWHASCVTTMVHMWNLCRAIMFSCDQNERPPELAPHDNLVTFLGFVFYGPALPGPLLTHTDYVSSLTTGAVTEPVWPRLRRLLATLARLAAWLLVLDVSNHLIHYHALFFSPDDVRRLFGRWEIAGLIFWAGQYFHVKYVVIYGVSCAMAAFEGVPTPLPPRCVSWITSYSDMWKYFDHGLYLFMRRHIYRPLCGERPSSARRMAASVVVFMFVYAWHGLSTKILVWSLANFVCVTLERVDSQLAKSRRGQEWRRMMGPGLWRRCQALLQAPLFLVSMVSQAGFLTDSLELGWLAIGKAVAPQSALDVIVTLGFMYCACQVSYDIKRWHQQRARLPPPDDKVKQP